MAFTVLASGDNFITGSVSSLAALVFNLSIGQVNPAEIEQFVNGAAYEAELNQPEGAAIEFDLSGWTVFGTDYSTQIANQINSYWQQGQFTVNGEDMQAWPGASVIAYGGNDTLTVQYLKGQIWILYIALAVALFYAVVYIFQQVTGQKWSVGVNSATTSSGGWWNNLPFYEKALIVVAGTGLLIGGVFFVGKLEIAKAGASHTEINIEK